MPAISSTEKSRTIRVVIADDHAVVRDGLRALVEAQPGLEVVGEASDGEKACVCARDLEPDVLLLDLSMPGVTGIEAAERITKDCPRVRVLALTMHEERGYVAHLLRAGAAGYVLKRSGGSELVRAIRTVASGGSYVDPSLAGSLLTPVTNSSPRSSDPSRSGGSVAARDLSPREAEVLRLVATGHTNKEIAAALGIGVKTVETHKANGMSKLGLGNRAALVRFAIAEGWLGDGG